MGAKLDLVMKDLANKEAQLKEVKDGVAALNKEKDELIAKSKKLEEDLDTCKKKMVRAKKMIEGLAGEKERWTDTVASLTEAQKYITGNSLIASGMICYAGPFISQFREALEELWRNKM